MIFSFRCKFLLIIIVSQNLIPFSIKWFVWLFQYQNDALLALCYHMTCALSEFLWLRQTFRIYATISTDFMNSHFRWLVLFLGGGSGRGDNRCKYIHFILILNWDNEMRWGLFFTFYIIVIILYYVFNIVSPILNKDTTTTTTTTPFFKGKRHFQNSFSKEKS